MKSRDIALVGILLAAGAIARYISLFIPGAIVANLTIAFYCLAVILTVPKFKETIGIGFVAGIICAVFSHSIFPLGNLISEPAGAFAALFVYKLIRNRTELAPAITAAIATPISGLTFIGIICLVNILTAGASVSSVLLFAASMLPIVAGAAVVNTIIVQLIAMPAMAVMQKTQPVIPKTHSGPADKDAAVALDGVSFTYRAVAEIGAAPALNNMTVRIQKGEFIVVTGPSGSGKTTFCRAAAGILHHAYGGIITGDITIAGKYADEYENVEELSLNVGMVFDDADAQLIFTTVEEEIRTGLETRKLTESEIEEKLKTLYDLTQTECIKDQAPHSLSGGQKQRVAFAAALSKETSILILDEATSELDQKARTQVYSVLKDLAQNGRTIILVEHMVDETVHYATRQIRLESGRIVYDGIPVKDTAVIPTFEKTAPGVKIAASVKNLVHVYGKDFKALDDVSMELYAGEIVAVVGENGSGKTTLIKHLNGLLHPTSGSIEIFGQNIEKTGVSKIAESVGLVFQNPDTMLFENSCAKEVAFGLKNIGKNDSDAVLKALDDVGLSAKKEINPLYLSRGERQRLALACVLAMGQPILILDEPTTGLDLTESFEIMALLMKIRNEGKTILMVTHSPKIAEIAADRVIEMKFGKVVSVTNEKSKSAGEILESTDLKIERGD